MYRAWSIADGPADLTEQAIGTSLTVTIERASGKRTYAKLDVETVGDMHGGAIRSFSGQLHIDRAVHHVVGTYHTGDRTGSCHTTDA